MVTLLQSIEDFSEERLLGGVDLTIEAPECSFSAWVKTTPQFVRGRSQESVYTNSLSTSPSLPYGVRCQAKRYCRVRAS
jgi:hypothetical protein